MKFRLEHETVGFEYTVDSMTVNETLGKAIKLLRDEMYMDIPQTFRVMVQGLVRALLAYMQIKGLKLDINRGEDPVIVLLTELPILVNETGVLKDAVLTFRVSETNDSPTITDIQLQL